MQRQFYVIGDEQHVRPKRRLKNASWFVTVSFLFMGIGCVNLIANYDPVTYKSLTDLKAEMILFVEKMDPAKPYAQYTEKFEDLQLKVEKVYEYEKGKKLNNDTIAQVSEIRRMILDMMGVYKEQNKLSAFYLQEKKTQLETAFDLAIATENLKLKGTQ